MAVSLSRKESGRLCSRVGSAPRRQGVFGLSAQRRGRRSGRRLGAAGSGLPSASNISILALAQLAISVALRLLRDIARRLVLHLVEGREGLHPLPLDLDDVPAELGLDRIGDLAGLQLERDFGEFRHHAVLGEPAEIAAFAGRVLGEFGRDLGEILAGLDARQRLLGVVLGRQQDVAGVDFRLRRLRLGGVVIGLVLGVVGRGGLGDVAQQPSIASLSW